MQTGGFARGEGRSDDFDTDTESPSHSEVILINHSAKHKPTQPSNRRGHHIRQPGAGRARAGSDSSDLCSHGGGSSCFEFPPWWNKVRRTVEQSFSGAPWFHHIERQGQPPWSDVGQVDLLSGPLDEPRAYCSKRPQRHRAT